MRHASHADPLNGDRDDYRWGLEPGPMPVLVEEPPASRYALPEPPLPAGPPARTRLARACGPMTIDVELQLEGSGRTELQTGLAYLDDLLRELALCAGFDLTVRGVGTPTAGAYSVVDEVAYTVGQAIRDALLARPASGEHPRHARRFGEAHAVVGEALARCVLHVGGRAHLSHSQPESVQHAALTEGFSAHLLHETFASLAAGAGATLHVTVLAGENPHQVALAQVAATARALRALL